MAMNHDARVVLASGIMTSADADRARALGIREVILQPNTVEALGPLVHRLLRTSRDAAVAPIAPNAPISSGEREER